MLTCPHCGATVPESAGYCGHCGAATNSPTTPLSAPQPQAPHTNSSDMTARLEKAMRRAELLSYAAAGLGVAILAVLIGIAFV